MHLDTYTREYQIFRQRLGESLDSVGEKFDNIISNLCSCGALTFTENQIARQLFYSFDESIWGVNIAYLEESSVFTTLTCEKLFSKLKTHEIAKKSRANTENRSSSSLALVSSSHGGMLNNNAYASNPSRPSFSLEFVLSSVISAIDEMDFALDEDLALLA